LGASLIHLLPDAEDITFEKFPLAHLCCGAGFFIALILEKVLFQHQHDHNDGHAKHEEEVLDDTTPKLSEMSTVTEEPTSPALRPKSSQNIEIVRLVEPTEEESTNGPIHEHQASSGGYILFAVLALESL
jgi:hypothetical protein